MMVMNPPAARDLAINCQLLLNYIRVCLMSTTRAKIKNDLEIRNREPGAACVSCTRRKRPLARSPQTSTVQPVKMSMSAQFSPPKIPHIQNPIDREKKRSSVKNVCEQNLIEMQVSKIRKSQKFDLDRFKVVEQKVSHYS